MDANASQQDSQARLRCRKLVDNLPSSVIFVLNRSLVVTFAGGGLATKYAFRPELYLQRSARDFIPPDVFADIEPHLQSTFAGREASFELAYSSSAVFQVCTTPLQEDGGSIAEILVIALEITQRKLAELALAEREARYRSLFEDNHSVMLLFDRASGEIVDVNPAAAAYYGWSRAQMRTMSVFDIHALPLAEVRAEVARADAEGRHFYRFKQRRADGSVRDLEAYSSPVELNGRELRYAIMHDMTERNAAEKALRQSEAALRRSQAVAHIGHWAWDALTNALNFSDEANHILGLEPTTGVINLDESLRRAIHPDDLDRARELRRGLRGGREPVGAEFRVVWPDSSTHYVWVMSDEPERASDGKVLRNTGVMQDITERKLRELEREELVWQLQSTARQLSQVVRSAPDAVVLLDNLGNVLLTNPKADTLLAQHAAYDEEGRLRQLAGAAWEELLVEPAAGQWHTLRTDPQVFEAIAQRVEGDPVPAGYVMVVRDVTAASAGREQLQQQERLAALGQLAAGIAHDFNNIMSVISVYAEMMGDVPGLTARERAHTQTIIDQTQRAARLIRQVLDFSRRSLFERHVLDLLPLLKQETKLLRETLPESIEIEFSYAPGEYVVLADLTRIQQLVMNLAVNSRDAMPEGGTLGITLAHSTAGPSNKAAVRGPVVEAWVQIIVSDTGTGISLEHLEHIFDPFFTTKAPGRGTGLGLAQVYGIVAQHDGYITVASEPGAGTAFTIYLPAATAWAQAAVKPAVAALPLGQGQLVLLVEDDAAVRCSLAALLRGWNYQVVEAANGQEALACLAQPEQQVNVIVSDVVMPRLGGVGLVKALRSDGVATPIILMSGHTASDARAGMRDAGVLAWLDKPLSSPLLAEALARAVGSRGKA